eukprot:GHVL01010466.1.p1 GENE.GHVL01010466.1~~GHVL01010466.1.p1  ORF type:complete len:520 (+),score=91.69 GHVL01010466.1:446-2005(+)
MTDLESSKIEFDSSPVVITELTSAVLCHVACDVDFTNFCKKCDAKEQTDLLCMNQEEEVFENPSSRESEIRDQKIRSISLQTDMTDMSLRIGFQSSIVPKLEKSSQTNIFKVDELQLIPQAVEDIKEVSKDSYVQTCVPYVQYNPPKMHSVATEVDSYQDKSKNEDTNRSISVMLPDVLPSDVVLSDPDVVANKTFQNIFYTEEIHASVIETENMNATPALCETVCNNYFAKETKKKFQTPKFDASTPTNFRGLPIEGPQYLQIESDFYSDRSQQPIKTTREKNTQDPYINGTTSHSSTDVSSSQSLNDLHNGCQYLAHESDSLHPSNRSTLEKESEFAIIENTEKDVLEDSSDSGSDSSNDCDTSSSYSSNKSQFSQSPIPNSNRLHRLNDDSTQNVSTIDIDKREIVVKTKSNVDVSLTDDIDQRRDSRSTCTSSNNAEFRRSSFFIDSYEFSKPSLAKRIPSTETESISKLSFGSQSISSDTSSCVSGEESSGSECSGSETETESSENSQDCARLL